MAMTPYEVVRRSIEFDTPDRLPLRFELLGLSDVHEVCWRQIGTGDHSRRRTIDEWGCEWSRSEEPNMGQVKGHPLADWSALASYHWPDPDDPDLFADAPQQAAEAGDKYAITSIFMLLFERMHALRGFTNTLTDLLLERERIEMLADRIVEFDLRIIENMSHCCPGQIHGFRFTDDWGTQQNLFINPHLWDEFFRPRYQRIVDAVHKQGWHVWMHSCGKINAILDSLVAIGVDVLNLQQPRALGIEQVGQHMRGRVCFESLCDIQRTLPFKAAADIREEAQLLLEHWSTPDGGFILSDYGDGQAIGVPLEKKEIMLAAFRDFDPWKS
jgi:hypothetical protein